MAEGSLMGEAECIWLVQTPSANAHAWRDALGRACAERDWDFAVHERGYPMPVTRPGKSMLVVAWLDQAGDLAVTHWAAQLSPPSEAEAVLKGLFGLNDHDALYEASMRLATAWAVVEHGGSASWSDDPAIELPGLGRIPRPQGATPEALTPTDHPLVAFQRGASAGESPTQWSPDIFLYPDLRTIPGPTGSMSLVGRRRLLMNGPNIFLPAGNWVFSAEISIDPPGLTELLIEWGHGHEVVSLTSTIDVAGRYALTLEKRWTGIQPADFRISLMIPALEGEFVFHGGVLTRRPD